MAAGLPHLSLASIFGFLAVVLASINIFGGFLVTKRMLGMFSGPKQKSATPKGSSAKGETQDKGDAS